MCLVQSPPYLSIKIPKHDDEEELVGNKRYEGYCADLALKLAEKLRIKYSIPFVYELQLVKDEKYGAKQDDGTWNGMIGELTRKVSRQVNNDKANNKVYNNEVFVSHISARVGLWSMQMGTQFTSSIAGHAFSFCKPSSCQEPSQTDWPNQTANVLMASRWFHGKKASRSLDVTVVCF